MCPALFAELEHVLMRPKFRPYVTAPEVLAYVALLQRLSSIEPDPEVEAGLTPDPGDDYLIALARVAGSHFIVSGDPHSPNSSKPGRLCSLQELFSGAWPLNLTETVCHQGPRS